MKKLFIKIFAFSFPVLILIGLYFVRDPFKVVYNYDNYYNETEHLRMPLNRDFVSTETLLKHYKRRGFDSYIFGNSRTVAFQASQWGKYIASDRIFHFDASIESLYGVEKKIRLLEKKGIPMSNALFIVDHGLLQKVDNSTGSSYIKDPQLSGESRLSFQLEFIKTFFNPVFLRQYLDYTISGKAKDYMISSGIFENRAKMFDSTTNEINLSRLDSIIDKDVDAYYEFKKEFFYKRDSLVKISDPVINDSQRTLLNNINRILTKNKCVYKIVISPLYDQQKLAPADLQELNNIFGPAHVFDFSGINAITNDIHNYYEDSHYRAHIGATILQRIYAPVR
jgi:hypothetical protein